MREALAAEVGAGHRERLAVPAVEAEYGIESVTARIDDLYEQLALTSRPRFRRHQPARPVPGASVRAASPGAAAVGTAAGTPSQNVTDAQTGPATAAEKVGA